METLPFELSCRIFSEITDPHQIVKLLRIDSYTSSMVKNCIDVLKWSVRECNDCVPSTFVRKFNNIREVGMPIYVQSVDELMDLTSLKLNVATIDVSELEIFDVTSSCNKNLSSALLMIKDFYENSSINIPSSNKKITFHLGQPNYYIEITDNGLDFELPSDVGYEYLYPLMKAIDNKEGLFSFAHIDCDKSIIKQFAIEFTNLQKIIYRGEIFNVFKYLKLTNVNHISYPIKNLVKTHVVNATGEMSYLVSRKIRHGHHGVFVKNVNLKQIYLEIPV